jgi:hypothetical protein
MFDPNDDHNLNANDENEHWYEHDYSSYVDDDIEPMEDEEFEDDEFEDHEDDDELDEDDDLSSEGWELD